MSEFGLIEPFGIDDGELNGIRRATVFTLGVEWEMFRNKLESTPAAFTLQISNQNADRLSAMCQRHGRFCEVQPCPIVDGFPVGHFDDWRTIVVGDAK